MVFHRLPERIMKVSLTRSPSCTTRIIPVPKEGASLVPDFEGEKGTIAVTYENDRTQILCGIGERGSCTENDLRGAAARAVRKARDLKRTSVTLEISGDTLSSESGRKAFLEGALLGAYSFAKYKSSPPPELTKIEVTGGTLSQKDIKAITRIVESVNLARDLVNENAGVMIPEQLAAQARAIAKKGSFKIKVMTETAIDKEGLGLLKAVGQGSPYPPRLIILEYKGDPKSKRVTAILGKGITFDSGGQNLKPNGHIEDMRIDMGGAAAVLGTMNALALTKPKVNVIGVVAAAHNAIDGRSYFPGDIYRSYSGKTVEIMNTDAEGRLVLADAIAYCRKHYAPSEMIDLATLTGGILIALGNSIAGLFSNNDQVSEELFASGEKTGERLWRFPLYEEFSEAMKSDLADLRNLSKFKKGHASSITAAAFLQHFVEDTPWAHLDIAGTAYNQGEAKGETPKYGTGFGVRLLIDYLTK